MEERLSMECYRRLVLPFSSRIQFVIKGEAENKKKRVKKKNVKRETKYFPHREDERAKALFLIK